MKTSEHGHFGASCDMSREGDVSLSLAVAEYLRAAGVPVLPLHLMGQHKILNVQVRSKTLGCKAEVVVDSNVAFSFRMQANAEHLAWRAYVVLEMLMRKLRLNGDHECLRLSDLRVEIVEHEGQLMLVSAFTLDKMRVYRPKYPLAVLTGDMDAALALLIKDKKPRKFNDKRQSRRAA